MIVIIVCLAITHGALASGRALAQPRHSQTLKRVAEAGRGIAVQPARPPLVTAPRTSNAPAIDGHLDDLMWRTAVRVTRFVQRRPIEGAPATEDTDVWIAYDTQHLYLGVYAHYSSPRLIRTNRADRDQTGRDDRVSFFFDPFRDQQRAYVFSVNGYGVQGDALMGSGRGGGGGAGRGGGGPGDPSWDALFFSSGQLVADGWTAELAIPFKSLRYPARKPGELHEWGFQIQRDIQSKNETVVWAPMSRDVMGFISQMGVITGMRDLSTNRNLELLPTFTAIHAAALDSSSGSYQAIRTRPEAGLNVKYGITSNLIADFTANPDFSQIESDRPQIEVNQRFPLFFEERRPFFLEGQEIFSIPGPATIVHTRTIVEPRIGAKISGKLGRTTLGLLVTDDVAAGKTDDPADPVFGRSAQVFVGRLRYDLYAESHVGLVATGREFMSSHSRVGGVDGQFRLGPNHRIGFRVVASDLRALGDERQSGTLLDVDFRAEGRNLRYGASHFAIAPGFATEVGFVRRVDTRQTDGHIEYRWWPEQLVQDWGPRLEYSRNHDFAGLLQDEDLRLDLAVQFAGNIDMSGGISRRMERYAGIHFRQTRLSLGGRIDSSRHVAIGASFNAGDQIRFIDNPFLGRGTEFNAFITLRPWSRLMSEIDINTSRLTDPRTGVAAFDVKIFRTLTTFQFTNRLLARHIIEVNTFDKTVGLNLLATYRVNAGTVFYVGYDDHYQHGTTIDDFARPDRRYHRTNRAIFTKLQYLFRY